MNTLKINNLCVDAEGKRIVDGVNLEVKTGEVLVLMGPNGCGKSTLSYAIAGNPRYKIVEGKIVLNGREINKMSVDKRARSGIFLAFQNPVSIPGVGVSSVLRMVLREGDFSSYYQNLKLTSTDLKLNEELLRRPLNEDMSGGEKKKMEILQVEVLKPKFVIFDEIDTGLDVDALRLIGEKINKIKKNTGILIITHYQRLLKYLDVDRVAVMKNGRVIRNGGVELASVVETEGYAAFN